jgi:hypothetical protein
MNSTRWRLEDWLLFSSIGMPQKCKIPGGFNPAGERQAGWNLQARDWRSTGLKKGQLSADYHAFWRSSGTRA